MTTYSGVFCKQGNSTACSYTSEATEENLLCEVVVYRQRVWKLCLAKLDEPACSCLQLCWHSPSFAPLISPRTSRGCLTPPWEPRGRQIISALSEPIIEDSVPHLCCVRLVSHLCCLMWPLFSGMHPPGLLACLACTVRKLVHPQLSWHAANIAAQGQCPAIV